MDDFKSERIFLENQHNLSKVYRESEVLSKVSKDYQDLRFKFQPYEPQLDINTIDKYKSQRERKLNRSDQKMHNRFPSIQPSTQQSTEALPPLEDIQVTLVPQNNNNKGSFKSLTLASALKMRKIVHPENELQQSMSKAFIPVNPFEAKGTIMRTIQYDSQRDPQQLNNTVELNLNDKSSQMPTSVLQKYAFKRTSPSPNHLQKETKSLNDKNKFTTFLPTQVEQPRLSVLHNFREISRIMTNNFLKNKELEKKYRKQQMPRDELVRKRIEDQATSQMTSLMKQLNSPRNFTSPIKKSFTQSNSVSRVVNSPINDLSSQPSRIQLDNSYKQYTNNTILVMQEGRSRLPQIKSNLYQNSLERTNSRLNQSVL